jgi:FSR family fosmidomycin resistance protein-like MFS transporter
MTPRLRNPVLWLSAGHMVTDIYLPVITSVLPLLMATRGYSYFLAGLLVTGYNLTSSLTQPLFGWLSDRHGWALPLSYSLLISGFFVALMGLVDDYAVLLVFASIAALGHSSFHPNALSAINRLCRPGSRGQTTAFFVVGGNVGYAVGPIIAGVVVFAFGLRGLSLVFIPALLLALLLWFGVPEGALAPTVAPPPGTRTGPEPSRGPAVMLFVTAMLRAWAIFGALAFFPSLLVDRGYPLVQANMLLSFMLLAGVAGQIAGGYLSDRFGRKEFVLAGTAAAIPAFLLFVMAGGPVSIAALHLFGFVLWSGLAVTVAMAHELMPRDVGLASGLLLGVAVGAGGLGVAVTGMLADRFSLSFAIGSLPFVVAAACITLLMVRYPWKRGAGSAA